MSTQSYTGQRDNFCVKYEKIFYNHLGPISFHYRKSMKLQAAFNFTFILAAIVL